MSRSKINIIFVMILAFAMLGFVNAEYGCCYDANSGSCAQNSEYSACINNGGTFSASTSCSISSCIKGCCVLGTNTVFSTSRECEILSRAKGFPFPGTFTSSDEQTCYNLGRAQTTGACVYGTGRTRDCKYSTYAECGSGEFHQDTLCSQPSLNTTCNKTTDTMCYNENVHYKDSCGNADARKEVCDYDAGLLCTTKTSKEAYCKSLNCDNGKKNGESWCIPPLGIEPDLVPWQIIDKELIKVGSRYFIKSCLNGEIITEPCADYREEICNIKDNSGGKAKCEKNNYQDCFDANGEENPVTGFKFKEEDCSEDSCIVITSTDAAPCSSLAEINGGADLTKPSFCAKAPGSKNKIEDYQAKNEKTQEVANPLLTDLGIGVCAPQIAPGQELGGKSDEGTCSAGDYTAQVILKAHYDKKGTSLWGRDASPMHWYVSVEDDAVHKYGYAGLISTDPTVWELGKKMEPDTDNSQVSPKDPVNRKGLNPLNKYVGKSSFTSTLPIDLTVLMSLSNLCKHMGDCVGKLNWQGVGGSNSGEGPVLTCKGDSSKRTCTVDFKCVPWKAPAGNSNCQKCGSDKLPCSEYRCLSLGKACEYFEPEGADKGYCIANDDSSAPSITCNNCPTELLPFTGAQFTITTNEDAMCKFDINKAGATFSDMEYDFGEGYDTTHSVILNLPGQISSINASDIDAKEYDLITQDGKYTIYVRCIDVAGNGETGTAHPINFNVLAGPDTSAPFLKQFLPVSGSAIKYNTTQKVISFSMNEPAECKWSLKDEDYDVMNNNHTFTCDTSIKTSGILDQYSCSGILTNVTLNRTQETLYYIKCKDQPWLEGKEYNLSSTLIYKRNKHTSQNDYTYILRPSEKLQINEITPLGTISKPSYNTSFDIETSTSGGGSGGIAECKWRISKTNNFNGTALTRFFNTNSNRHKQMITGQNESQYYLNVRCQDISENIAETNSTFYLKVDDTSPVLTRLFNRQGQLSISTNENSFCIFSLDSRQGCFFDYLNNGTALNGLDKQHTTTWLYDKRYYILCKDYQGNYNNGCIANIRTY